jgi:hypothetical protein
MASQSSHSTPEMCYTSLLSRRWGEQLPPSVGIVEVDHEEGSNPRSDRNVVSKTRLSRSMAAYQ